MSSLSTNKRSHSDSGASGDNGKDFRVMLLRKVKQKNQMYLRNTFLKL